MEILATCSYEDSLGYDGKLIIDDESGKSNKVSLNVVVTNGDTSILGKMKPSVKCITYIGDVDFNNTEIPKDKVFVEYNMDTLPEEIVLPDGVTPILRVDDSYCDMRTLKGLCSKYGTLRVVGGNLLNIDGVRIGRYSVGKDKGSPLYNGIYDTFLEVNLSDLSNLKNIVKRVKRREDSDSTSKSAKSAKQRKAVSKKGDLAKSFSSLFSDEEEDF